MSFFYQWEIPKQVDTDFKPPQINIQKHTTIKF